MSMKPVSLLFCSSLMLAMSACGDSKSKDTSVSDAGGEDASTDTGSDGGTTDAGKDAGAKDAGSGCPADTECVSPQGVYLCERPGRDIPLCETDADCPFGTCFPLSGQGVCVATCTPEEGFPSTTSVSGVVVEFEAGKGIASQDEAPVEKPVKGVSVCVQSTGIKTPVPCVETDADGKFELTGLPPNRSLVTQVGALLTFEKDGYLNAAQGFALGGGSQLLGNQVRLLTTATATALASTLGAELPSATTGWIEFAALTVNKDGVERLSTWSQGKLALMTLDEVSAGAKPMTGAFAGAGPFYAAADETFSVPSTGGTDAGAGDAGTDAGTDAGAVAASASTSTSGIGFFTDVPAGNYNLTFKHPSLDCGAASPATVIPGYVLVGVGPLCGAGVR